MIELEDEVRALIRQLFPADDQARAAALLEQTCNDNLPNIGPLIPTNTNLARIRFGALKLSEGKFEKLQRIVKMDWRDILVAAGFANSLEEHKRWADRILHPS